jgi:hypothetical protein
MATMQAMFAIQRHLAELDEGAPDALRSGQRAALWRAQHQAARRSQSLDGLRRYCLDALKHPRFLEPDEENDYLRGYREGLQLVLSEIRRIETRPRRA